jgi:hypothetical protein
MGNINIPSALSPTSTRSRRLLRHQHLLGVAVYLVSWSTWSRPSTFRDVYVVTDVYRPRVQPLARKCPLSSAGRSTHLRGASSHSAVWCAPHLQTSRYEYCTLVVTSRCGSSPKPSRSSFFPSLSHSQNSMPGEGTAERPAKRAGRGKSAPHKQRKRPRQVSSRAQEQIGLAEENRAEGGGPQELTRGTVLTATRAARR